MPPVSQQGSRAGLISAVVIFTILFVVATVFAFYFNAQWKKAEDDLLAYRGRYTEIIADQALSSSEVQELKAMRNEPTLGFNPQMKVFDVALKQRDDLARLITGAPSAAAPAVEQATRKLSEAGTRLKDQQVNVPADNLMGAVAALADALAVKQTQMVALQKDVDAAKKQVQDVLKQTSEQLAVKDKQIEDINKRAGDTTDAAQKDRTAKQAQFDEIQKQIEADRKAAQEALAKKDVEMTAKNAELKKVQQAINAVQTRLAGARVNVNEPTIRQADGVIARVPGNNVVFINRGLGDQIVAGMTFEVYDKGEGIPALGDGLSPDNMPIGKASIEVMHVAPTSSECRVIKLKPGSTLTEGDLIVNLIYDPNAKYNFVVYGKFDLDQNGVATAPDAEVVKRLITQWGAKVGDKVSVDTDFVVMGKEPVVPVFTAEELQDPLNTKKLDDAKAEADAYAEVRQQARDLHIPILNQNRFLYFIGYYELARK